MDLPVTRGEVCDMLEDALIRAASKVSRSGWLSKKRRRERSPSAFGASNRCKIRLPLKNQRPEQSCDLSCALSWTLQTRWQTACFTSAIKAKWSIVAETGICEIRANPEDECESYLASGLLLEPSLTQRAARDHTHSYQGVVVTANEMHSGNIGSPSKAQV